MLPFSVKFVLAKIEGYVPSIDRFVRIVMPSIYICYPISCNVVYCEPLRIIVVADIVRG